METLFKDFVMLGAVSSCIALLVVLAIAITLYFHNRKIENTFMMIYKDSEGRIGNANLMVKQCTESLQTQSLTAKNITDMYSIVTQEYVKQLEALRKHIDVLEETNRELARSVDELTAIVTHHKDQTINFNTTK